MEAMRLTASASAACVPVIYYFIASLQIASGKPC